MAINSPFKDKLIECLKFEPRSQYPYQQSLAHKNKMNIVLKIQVKHTNTYHIHNFLFKNNVLKHLLTFTREHISVAGAEVRTSNTTLIHLISYLNKNC